MKLDQLIEAVLYYRGEPVSKKELGKILQVGQETIAEAATLLRQKLDGRGVALVETDSEFSLGTSPACSELIGELAKEEKQKDLGKAGLETLTIVAYKGPISRSAIDNIRGVNSSFILRNLLIRGLVERVDNPLDQRAFLYKPTVDLLKYLGVEKVEDLPEFGRMAGELKETAPDGAEEGVSDAQ